MSTPDDKCPEHPRWLAHGCPECSRLYPCPRGSETCLCPDFNHRDAARKAVALGGIPLVFHSDPRKDMFLILSLKRSKGGVLTWWAPNNNGYVTNIEKAGLYSREQVESNPRYYNSSTARTYLARDVFSGKVGEVRRVVVGHVLESGEVHP